MPEGRYVYAVLFKHCYAYVLRYLLKLCKYDCGWGKLEDFRHIKI